MRFPANDHHEFIIIRKFVSANLLALQQSDNLLVLNSKAFHSEGITTTYFVCFYGIIIRDKQIICTVN